MSELVGWVISAISVLSLVLVGNKKKVGWLVGIVNEALWFWFAVASHQRGLIIGVLVYTVVDIRNYILWSKQEAH